MPAFARAAEFSRHKKMSPALPPLRPTHRFSRPNPDRADRNHHRTLGARLFRHRRSPPRKARRPSQSAIKLVIQLASRSAPERSASPAHNWAARHRGEIAQRSHHCFPAHRRWLFVRPKMYPFHDAVCFNRSKTASGQPRPRNHLPRRQQHRAGPTSRRDKLRDQSVFTDLPQLHCGSRSGNASALREMKLKSACIVIETRIEPLHS